MEENKKKENNQIYDIKKKISKHFSRIIKYDFSIGNIARYLKTNGLKGAVGKAKEIITGKSPTVPYVYKQPIFTEQIKSEIEKFEKSPKVSIIIPVYNVEPKWIELAIQSVKNQWYTNWEICIVDDCSTNVKTIDYLKSINDEKIKIEFSKTNEHISATSNKALKIATGEYIGLMDNDDEITEDALYHIVKKINQGYTFIYSDEDKMEMDGTLCDPHFKPDFSPDMINSQNYISHFTVIKKEHINKVNGFTIGLEGSQDYDLYLKIFDMCEDVKIAHIPKVLYHWRKIPGSTASGFNEKSYAQESGRKALENSIKRKNIDAIVSSENPGIYKVNYTVIGEPKVSIIIPFKDAKQLLTLSVESVLNKTSYDNFEIIGISNNSEKLETFEEMKRLEELDNRVKFYEYDVPFNYSDINNYAVKNYVTGDYIVLLNNDIEIITENWIEQMLGFAQRDNVGAVGAKLYYPNNTIQHAGVIVGLGGVASHSHKHFNRNHPGYFRRLQSIQNLSAVTAAMLMVSKNKYNEMNGLNEENLKVAFNDVDFCLRLQKNGYYNVFTPYVEAYHHESVSRGSEDTPEKAKRFLSEIEYMQNTHKDIIEYDPYYNINLTIDKEDFSLKG